MREPTTVGRLIKRMRGMLGHLGPRDRETVLAGIEAIEELTIRLHEAHVQMKPLGLRVQMRRDPLDAVATDGAKVSL